MLIYHRYTLKYTPSLDRILPSPSSLHVRVKNTSAIALRAAYLHGPYTLYAATYPSTFNPNCKHETSEEEGNPDFEPNLKAGGSWTSHLQVPEKIRETAGKANVRRTTDGAVPSCTWIIEVSSQVLFSTNVAVHFEILVGRDEKSIELGFSALTGHGAPTPGQLHDHQQGRRHKQKHNAQPKGVFSKAVHLVVDDTDSLWNKPALPEWNDEGEGRGEKSKDPRPESSEAPLSRRDMSQIQTDNVPINEPSETKRKKVHLVVLTHGLHSNLGADMLYLKESIDAAAKEAREDARKRKESRRVLRPNSHDADLKQNQHSSASPDEGTSTAPLSGGQEDLNPETIDDEDEEEVIVRGFSGNAVRTEKGIQYLGKRLAKYVLKMTYPDQPFLPVKRSMTRTLSRAFTGSQEEDNQAGLPAHKDSSIHHGSKKPSNLAYKITSISFIAHSLGGLTQTYAIAYIHKHSPRFFEEIKPINFVTMASPFLGLSNENPMYVKFALDFGLVGRTGQDLGLTWRAPTMVRSGWGAMIGGIGSEGQRAQKQPDPGAKPLLRVLPTGPAHQVLKLFRNRTVYSNVVNDGIVPLRTSCLLFLDWSGLGRVEKARRENGLFGTMAGWGWAEMTGTNSSQRRRQGIESAGTSGAESGEERSRSNSRDRQHQATVPQPAEDATKNDTTTEEQEVPEDHQFIDREAQRFQDEEFNASKAKESSPAQPQSPFAGFLNFLRPNQNKSQHHSPKNTKIYKRGQTIKGEQSDGGSSDTSPPPSRPGMARGESILDDPNNTFAPPKTTFFESAGDILNPPLPNIEFLINPSSRPRTIFHDRVYHPEEIPPPPMKSRVGLKRSFSSDASRKALTRANTDYGDQPTSRNPDTSGMKVEEKIARAYHRDLSWRKVLVRLEPDAHNNICVRRMFANAYGWPVVKHLVDTHFSSGFEATTADEREDNAERAKPIQEPVGEHGEELREKTEKPLLRTDSEIAEAKDDVKEMRSLQKKNSSLSSSSASRGRQKLTRQDSAMWDDTMFEVTDDDDDDDILTPVEARKQPHSEGRGHGTRKKDDQQHGTTDAEIADFLQAEPAEAPEGLGLPRKPEPIPTTASSPNPEVAVTPATPKNLPPMESSSPGGTSAVGLGKSVEEQMGSPGSKSRKKDREDYEDSQGILADMTRMTMGRE